MLIEEVHPIHLYSFEHPIYREALKNKKKGLFGNFSQMANIYIWISLIWLSCPHPQNLTCRASEFGKDFITQFNSSAPSVDCRQQLVVVCTPWYELSGFSFSLVFPWADFSSQSSGGKTNWFATLLLCYFAKLNLQQHLSSIVTTWDLDRTVRARSKKATLLSLLHHVASLLHHVASLLHHVASLLHSQKGFLCATPLTPPVQHNLAHSYLLADSF